MDVLWSFLKVIVFSVVVILVHCYYGYTATGGPGRRGRRGRPRGAGGDRAAMLLDFFLSLAIWGATTTVRIAG